MLVCTPTYHNLWISLLHTLTWPPSYRNYYLYTFHIYSISDITLNLRPYTSVTLFSVKDDSDTPPPHPPPLLLGPLARYRNYYLLLF